MKASNTSNALVSPPRIEVVPFNPNSSIVGTSKVVDPASAIGPGSGRLLGTSIGLAGLGNLSNSLQNGPYDLGEAPLFFCSSLVSTIEWDRVDEDATDAQDNEGGEIQNHKFDLLKR